MNKSPLQRIQDRAGGQGAAHRLDSDRDRLSLSSTGPSPGQEEPACLCQVCFGEVG